MGLIKYDHAPLLAPGRHFMSLAEIQPLCVRNFGRGTPSWEGRQILFFALENFVQTVLVAQIKCDLYIDGSFLTRKPNPDDVDVMVIIHHAIYEALSEEQKQVLDLINSDHFAPEVDATAWVAYPREHEHHGSACDGSLVIESYGIEHSQEWLKGFAVVRLWESNVGHLICR
jgi:hypothetical protein